MFIDVGGQPLPWGHSLSCFLSTKIANSCPLYCAPPLLLFEHLIKKLGFDQSFIPSLLCLTNSFLLLAQRSLAMNLAASLLEFAPKPSIFISPELEFVP